MPSDPDYITPPTDRRKCGAECVSFNVEGSSSLPSPVKEIKFEKRGQAQEQSTLCAAHVTDIVLLFDVHLVVKVLIPYPGLSSEFRPRNPSALLMMMRMSGKSLLSTLPIINKQWMRMTLFMIFTDMLKILCMRAVL